MDLKTTNVKLDSNDEEGEQKKQVANNIEKFKDKTKSKSLKILKYHKSKDNNRNLFAKTMIIQKKLEKINKMKKFSTNIWCIDNNSYVFIDFETANHKKTSACQISIIKVIQGKIIKTYSSLIKPYPNEFSFSHIHGITSESIILALDFKVLWPEIALFFDKDTIVIAHNASFDISVLRALINYYNLECPNFTYICSVKLFQKIYNYPNNLLNTLAHVNQIKFNHHDTLAEVMTLQKLINLHFSKHYHLKTLCSTLNIKMNKLFVNYNLTIIILTIKLY